MLLKWDDGQRLAGSRHNEQGWQSPGDKWVTTDQFAEFKAGYDKLSKGHDELAGKISDQQKALKNMQAQSEQMRANLERDRYKNVEIISIVAAFFAFIATEFQLFAHIKSFSQFLSISLIVFGCTSFFALIMARVARDPGKSDGLMDFLRNNKLLILSVVMILLGVFISAAGYLLEKSNIESKGNYIKTRHRACGELTDDIARFNFGVNSDMQKYEQLYKKYNNLRCDNSELLK